MKRKFLFLTMILCLIFAGVPAWADNIADADSTAQATAISGQGGAGGQGGTSIGYGQGGTGVGYGGNAGAQAVTGPSSANIDNVSTGPSSATSAIGDVSSGSNIGNVSSGSSSRVGDTSATIDNVSTGPSSANIDNVSTGPSSASVEGVDGGDVTLTQTFEASEAPDLWKQKGAAVLPGIASPNLMQQFVRGGVPLVERQDRVFQAMMALFPMEYRVVTTKVQGKSTLSSKRFHKKHWWSSKSEPKIPSIPFKTEIETDHTTITTAIHPWYRNFLSRNAWVNPATGDTIYPQKIGVVSVKVVNTSLSGNFVALGVIAASSKNPGGSPLPITDEVAIYVQKYFKGVKEVVLFDPEIGRGAVSGSEANSKGGGISTAIANFATFNTLTGGASLGGSSGTVMPVSVFGKCFMAMAPADSIGVKGTEIKITNAPPKKVEEKDEAVSDGGDGKKAVGSGVVK